MNSRLADIKPIFEDIFL